MTLSSTTTSPISSTDLRASLEIVEVKPGLKFSKRALLDIIPDTKTALFFGKVYELDYRQLSRLIQITCQSDVVDALLNEGGAHSSSLQDYVVDMLDFVPDLNEGDVEFDPVAPKGEFLPEVWESLEVEIAQSIKDVANKLGSTIAAMPGKQGRMMFKSMAVLNAKRPTIGDYRAGIAHDPVKDNLVILDVSGSMNANTVERIAEDVVALAYNANAAFAIVSDQCTYWDAGSYSVESILGAATYGGTHYEELAPLFDKDWGTVVTIADYDSAIDARHIIRQQSGRIDLLLDMSLVNRPTFMAECVGQLASEVRPLLVASDSTYGVLR